MYGNDAAREQKCHVSSLFRFSKPSLLSKPASFNASFRNSQFDDVTSGRASGFLGNVNMKSAGGRNRIRRELPALICITISIIDQCSKQESL